jgi:hypothetical protein
MSIIDNDIQTAEPETPGGDEQIVQASGELVLMVCKGFTGEIVRAVVSAEDTVVRALPLIADQIGYQSPDWEKIGLYNLTRDFEYHFTDRFCDCGTESGDLVVMADGQACHK